MNTSTIPSAPVLHEVVSPPRRGQPLLAWLVILGIVGFILWRQAEKPAPDESTGIVPMQMQGRYLVGVNSLKFPGASGKALYDQARSMIDTSRFPQRLRLAVLAGELVGPKEANHVLADLDRERHDGEVEASDDAREAWGLLRKLYIGYQTDLSSPKLASDDQTTLRKRLGWFGDLALAPEGGDDEARARALAPARRTVVGYALLGLCGVLALIAGGVLLVLLGCLAFLGRLKPRLSCGRGHGGIYAETFAVYMVVYLGLGYLMRFLPDAWMALWVQGLVMLFSLVALVWPILRGLTWRQVRGDLGLGIGKEPLTEMLCGVGTYLSAVPVLFAGILIMLGVMFVQRRLGLGDPMADGGPTHPIIGIALSADWWIWAQVFVVACVVAPLVEEIMFRGVFYGHLRDAIGGRGRAMSILLSAFVSSFVFAVIHPQGWLAVPALGGLAFVFALAREWRGSLVSPMIAHGINNGVSTLILLMMAS